MKLKLAEAGGVGTHDGTGGGFAGGTGTGAGSKTLVAQATLEPSEIQDLGDIIPQLLEIKNKANAPLVFRVQIEFGDGVQEPDAQHTTVMNELLEGLNHGLRLS